MEQRTSAVLFATHTLFFLLIVSLLTVVDSVNRPFRSAIAPKHTIVNYEVVVPEVISQDEAEPYPKVMHIRLESSSSQFTLILQLNEKLFTEDLTSRSYDSQGNEVISKGYPNCFYQGTVVGYPTWQVSLSTCRGYQGFFGDREDKTNCYQIEPLPDSASTTNNIVHALYLCSEINEEPGRCGADKVVSRTNGNTDRNSRVRRQTPNSPTLYVELIVVNDFAQFSANGLDLDQTLLRSIDIVNGIDVFFSEEYNIRVVLIEVITWSNGDQIVVTSNPDQLLDNFNAFPIATPNDAAMLFTGIDLNGGTIGIAFIAGICNTNSVSLTQDGGRSLIHVIATATHELGHNFNMFHDDGRNCVCNDPTTLCIMSATLFDPPPSQFSSCSRDDLLTGFNDLNLDSCLMNEPTVVINQECGNGIRENDEQCDCGTVEQCTDPCCDAQTCTFALNAVCNEGPCCTSSCQFASQDVECRAANGECDIAERCNGTSSECPSDDVILDGTPCSSGYCFDGSCPGSHDEQCNIAFGSSDGADLCYLALNPRGDQLGHCGSTVSGFIPCPSEDVRCGQLQCVDGEFLLEGAFEVPVIDVTTTIGGVFICRSFTTQPAQNVPSPGLVQDGTMCDTNRVCLAQQCIDVADITDLSCPTGTNGLVCSGNGVCNNRGICSCDVGFGGPFCLANEETTTEETTTEETTTEETTTEETTTEETTTEETTTEETTTEETTTEETTTEETTTEETTTEETTTEETTTEETTTEETTTEETTTEETTTEETTTEETTTEETTTEETTTEETTTEETTTEETTTEETTTEETTTEETTTEETTTEETTTEETTTEETTTEETTTEDTTTEDTTTEETTTEDTTTEETTTEETTTEETTTEEVTTTVLTPTTDPTTPADDSIVVEFERQFYSVIEGEYIYVCVVVVSGGAFFGDIFLNVHVFSAKQSLNVSGTIFLEAGVTVGQTRCTTLHFPNDNYVNLEVREFELQLYPLYFTPGLSFGENSQAWLFLIESSIVEVGFTALEYSVEESERVVYVCVQLLTPIHLIIPIVMRAETSDLTATAGQDYEAITEIVQLASKSDQLDDCRTCFTIPVFSDDIIEDDEFFTVSITAFDVGVIIFQPIATVRIINVGGIVLQFNDDTPSVDGNTLRLSYFSSVPPVNATCIVERTSEEQQDCTDGSAVFTLDAGNRPHGITIYVSYPNVELVLNRRVRSETTDVCWTHFINEGISVSPEVFGSGSRVTVQFQGTGPVRNSPPRIRLFQCTLFRETVDNQIFTRECFAPSLEIPNLASGVYFISVRPIDRNCRRQIQLLEHFTVP